MKKNAIRMVAALGAFSASGIAVAHTGSHEVSGFFSGITHPLMGLDHLAVILAVGLWLGVSARRQAPLLMSVFLAVMAMGAAAGAAGLALPGIETGIAASLLMAGLLVASLARLPMHASLVLVAAFALFNGAAHGSEMPVSATPLLYGAGMLLSTALLQLAGIGLGQLAQRVRAEWLLRGAGIVGGGFGAWLLLGA